MQYLIMCRSLTQAEKAARLLEKNSILADVVKAPQELHTQGCAYALSLYRYAPGAVSLMKKHNFNIGKVYARNIQGEYREVQL